jgi:branched-subunit amino acid transport protein
MRGQVEIWFILVGLAVVTGLTRGFFLLLGTRVELPESVQRALRYAPAGALVAIVMPEMLVIKGAAGVYEWQMGNPQTWGGVAAIITFIFARSMILTIVLGMIVYSAVRVFYL